MSEEEKEREVTAVVAVSIVFVVAWTGNFVSWWLALGLWLGLGLASTIWHIATRRVEFAGLSWATVSGKFVGSLLLGPGMAAPIIVYAYKSHTAAIKTIAKVASWGCLAGAVVFFSYHSGYWGFFAAVWYLSGLLVIKLAIRQGGTAEMTKTRKCLGILFAFVGGTFLLALLNTAEDLPLRQSQAKPTTG